MPDRSLHLAEVQNPRSHRVGAGLLGGGRLGVQVGEGEQVGRRPLEHGPTGEALVGGDVQEFARSEQAPVRVFAHRFAGYHDCRCLGEIAGADPYGAGCAGVLEVAVSMGAAGRAGKHVRGWVSG
jgi:hypothetical protein